MFLTPKVYGGITEGVCQSGQEITKVKGLKNKVSFGDLESLLTKKSPMKLNQEKWFKDIEKGKITVKEQHFKARRRIP